MQDIEDIYLTLKGWKAKKEASQVHYIFSLGNKNGFVFNCTVSRCIGQLKHRPYIFFK